MSWEYFSFDEMKCKCGCNKADMDPVFMSKLQALRKSLGFALPITSGYRCGNYNQEVSSTGIKGPHSLGRAVDIAVSGLEAYKLLQYAASFQFQGLGVKQSGPNNSRYIHLDDLIEKDGYIRPTVWSY